jgi:predicted NAD/FAD-binding protein
MPAGAPAPRRRIAVVGSGIAGLSVAWLLTREESAVSSTRAATQHDAGVQQPRPKVVLYEKAETLGMDAHALSVEIPCAASKSVCAAQLGDGSSNNDAAERPKTVRLDMPLRVFTETYYTNLTALYQQVGIKYEANNYSGSFVSIAEQDAPAASSATRSGATSAHVRKPDEFHFGYSNLLIGRYSVPFTFVPFWSSVFNTQSWSILFGWISFLYRAKRDSRQGGLLHRGARTKPDPDTLTFGAYLSLSRYSSTFLDKMLLPTLCAILTCSRSAVLAYPAPIVVEYLLRRNMHGVRHVSGGTQDVVDRLTRNVEVKLGTGVLRIEQSGEISEYPGNSNSARRRKLKVIDEHGGEELYDDVILACQANQASRMLVGSGPFCCQAASLAAIPYESSNLVLHTDDNLMPKEKHSWNSVNFLLPKEQQLCPSSPSDNSSSLTASSNSPPASPVSSAPIGVSSSSPPSLSPRHSSPSAFANEGMATIYLNRTQACLYSLAAAGVDPATVPNFFQSWNPPPGLAPRKEKTLHAASFERPVVTVQSLKELGKLHELQGADGLWMCGSYFLRGMPLLETAVTSAVQVAEALGATVPWRERQALQGIMDNSEADARAPLSGMFPFVSTWGALPLIVLLLSLWCGMQLAMFK